MVTVDLLTTGVDIPSICILVFMRRVSSRIPYDQMIGRATRLCPAAGKKHFRIFDAVDLYANLQEMSDMRPVVARPDIDLAQLVTDLEQAGTDEDRNWVRSDRGEGAPRRFRCRWPALPHGVLDRAEVCFSTSIAR